MQIVFSIADETDSGFDLGHSRSPTEVDDNNKIFADHVKVDARSSNTSSADTSGKPYTPIFKKKKQMTPVAKRRSVEQKSSDSQEYILQGSNGRGSDSSDDNDTELSSELDRISLHRKHTGETYATTNGGNQV